MIKKSCLSLLLTVVMLISYINLPAFSAENQYNDGNLIVNGDFEESENIEKTTNWNGSPWTNTGKWYYVGNTEATVQTEEDNSFLQVSNSAGMGFGQTVDVESETTYSIMMDIRSSGIQAIINNTSSSPTSGGGSKSKWVSGTDSWQTVTMDYTTGEGQTQFTLYFWCANGVSIDLDNVRIIKTTDESLQNGDFKEKIIPISEWTFGAYGSNIWHYNGSGIEEKTDSDNKTCLQLSNGAIAQKVKLFAETEYTLTLMVKSDDNASINWGFYAGGSAVTFNKSKQEWTEKNISADGKLLIMTYTPDETADYCIGFANWSKTNAFIYDVELTYISETAQPILDAEETPQISIDYDNDKLTGFSENGSYTIAVNDGEAEEVLPSNDGTLVIANDYVGAELSVIRKGVSGISRDSEAQKLVIPERNTVPEFTLNISDETITIPVGYYYGTTDTEYANMTAVGEGNAITVAPESSVYIYQPAIKTAGQERLRSAVQIVTAPERIHEKPTGITATNETAAGNDGTINLPDSDGMEYKLYSAAEWTSASGSTIKNLSAGTYYVRYASNGKKYASEYETVTIDVQNQITVTFTDEDGTTVLDTITVTPPVTLTDESYTKPLPAKAATAEYTYEFNGWTPEFTEISTNTVYKATYKESKRKYIVTWKIGDKEETEEYEYNEIPKYKGAEPTKDAPNDTHIYKFTGWGDITAVTEDRTYTAQWKLVSTEKEVTLTADKTAQWTANDSDSNYDLDIHGWTNGTDSGDWQTAAYIGFTMPEDFDPSDIQEAYLVVNTTSINTEREALLYGAEYNDFDNNGQYKKSGKTPTYTDNAIADFSVKHTGNLKIDITEYVKSMNAEDNAAFRLAAVPASSKCTSALENRIVQ